LWNFKILKFNHSWTFAGVIRGPTNKCWPGFYVYWIQTNRQTNKVCIYVFSVSFVWRRDKVVLPRYLLYCEITFLRLLTFKLSYTYAWYPWSQMFRTPPPPCRISYRGAGGDFFVYFILLKEVECPIHNGYLKSFVWSIMI